MLPHTFASRLTRAGVDIVTVKSLLAQGDINVTMRYAHTDAETKRRAVDAPPGYDSATVVNGGQKTEK